MEDRTDEVDVEHFVGGSVGDEPSVCEHTDRVAVASREVEVVEGDKYCALGRAHKVEQLELMGNIEVIRRLVENEVFSPESHRRQQRHPNGVA